MKHDLQLVYLKPYTIDLDDTKEYIEGERIVGTFEEKEDCYFKGVLFDALNQVMGEISLTKEEFDSSVEKHYPIELIVRMSSRELEYLCHSHKKEGEEKKSTA